MSRIVTIILLLISQGVFSQVKIAQLKYDGGGDWYANPSALKNLINFTNKHTKSKILSPYDIVDVNSDDIYKYPFIHATGHGNIVFSENQMKRLRNYLANGGFIHFDDNYGLYKYIMRELKKIYPNKEIVELPVSHPIFHQTFNFENGLPKIHEHDNKPPQAFAIFIKNRMVILFTYECDIGDGWEDEKVHNDPYSLRLQALQMGSNILEYVFTN